MGLTDRRAPVVISHDVDTDPRHLRATLADLHRSLPRLEPAANWKVRQLCTELIAHSIADQRSRDRALRLSVEILPTRVRLVLSGVEGQGGPDAAPDRGGSLQYWQTYVEGLADRWGWDRRGGSGPWFEIDRGSAE